MLPQRHWHLSEMLSGPGLRLLAHWQMLRPLLRLVAVVSLAAAIEIPYELCPDHPDLLGISSVRASPGSLHHGRMRFFVGLPLTGESWIEPSVDIPNGTKAYFTTRVMGQKVNGHIDVCEHIRCPAKAGELHHYCSVNGSDFWSQYTDLTGLGDNFDVKVTVVTPPPNRTELTCLKVTVEGSFNTPSDSDYEGLCIPPTPSPSISASPSVSIAPVRTDASAETDGSLTVLIGATVMITLLSCACALAAWTAMRKKLRRTPDGATQREEFSPVGTDALPESADEPETELVSTAAGRPQSNAHATDDVTIDSEMETSDESALGGTMI